MPKGPSHRPHRGPFLQTSPYLELATLPRTANRAPDARRNSELKRQDGEKQAAVTPFTIVAFVAAVTIVVAVTFAKLINNRVWYTYVGSHIAC